MSLSTTDHTTDQPTIDPSTNHNDHSIIHHPNMDLSPLPTHSSPVADNTANVQLTAHAEANSLTLQQNTDDLNHFPNQSNHAGLVTHSNEDVRTQSLPIAHPNYPFSISTLVRCFLDACKIERTSDRTPIPLSPSTSHPPHLTSPSSLSATMPLTTLMRLIQTTPCLPYYSSPLFPLFPLHTPSYPLIPPHTPSYPHPNRRKR